MATERKVRPGEEFVFCNGASAATVAECAAELQRLTPDQFHYHVNQEKNDIYNWIRDCLDAKLAQKIRTLQDREQIVQALADRPAPKTAGKTAPKASPRGKKKA